MKKAALLFLILIGTMSYIVASKHLKKMRDDSGSEPQLSRTKTTSAPRSQEKTRRRISSSMRKSSEDSWRSGRYRENEGVEKFSRSFPDYVPPSPIEPQPEDFTPHDQQQVREEYHVEEFDEPPYAEPEEPLIPMEEMGVSESLYQQLSEEADTPLSEEDPEPEEFVSETPFPQPVPELYEEEEPGEGGETFFDDD